MQSGLLLIQNNHLGWFQGHNAPQQNASECHLSQETAALAMLSWVSEKPSTAVAVMKNGTQVSSLVADTSKGAEEMTKMSEHNWDPHGFPYNDWDGVNIN